MNKLILIGAGLMLASAGMMLIYTFSADHSPGAVTGETKKLAPILPLIGPCLMGLSLMILGTLGELKKRNEAKDNNF